MATTEGFQVGVLPQFNPVNPSLASFNPIDVTHGLLSAIQLSGNVDQLKAFRQHAAEIAATEGVRTQLLQAQADQARVAAEHDAAVKQDAIDAAVAQYKAKIATTPKEAQQEVATIEANLPNIAPAAQVQGQAIQSQLADLSFKSRSRNLLEGGALTLSKNQQDLASMNARDAVVNFDEDKARKDDLDIQKAALEQAQASQARAAAEELSGRNASKEKVAAARAASVQNHYQAQNVLGANFAREDSALKNMEGTRAENPLDPSDQRFTVGMLANAYNKNPTGFVNFLKTTAGYPPETVTVPPQIQAQIDEVNLQKRRVKELADGLHDVSLGMIRALKGDSSTESPLNSVPDVTVPVYGIDPKTGKYGRIK